MSEDLRDAIREMLNGVARGVERPEERDAEDRQFRLRYAEVLAGAPADGSHLARELRAALLALVGDDDWPRALRHMERARRVVEGGWG